MYSIPAKHLAYLPRKHHKTPKNKDHKNGKTSGFIKEENEHIFLTEYGKQQI